MKEVYTTKLLSLEHTRLKDYFQTLKYPYMILPQLSKIIIEIGQQLSEDEFERIGDDIWISKKAEIFKSAYIAGPTIIDENAQIRHCAFIRGSAMIGKGAVVGNSCEIKNSVLFDEVQVPHYNYVGDSILGYKSHMGAGSITSNVKSDKTNIVIKNGLDSIQTELRKFGAIIGDVVEIGCGSILNPGSVIGVGTNIYPLSSVRGYVPENSIYKSFDNIVKKK